MNIQKDSSGSRLVGIAGTDGSGKDAAADHLAEEHQMLHISLSDLLRAESSRRNHDPTKLTELGQRLNAERGMGALCRMAYEQWATQRHKYLGGLVISSVRRVSEAQRIKDEDSILVYVDAAIEERYARVISRGRPNPPYKTFKEFQAYEDGLLHGAGYEDGPNLLAVKAMSQIYIWNMGTEQEFITELDTRLSLPVIH